ncbi:MAG: hypothetical protein CV090_15380 [Nitrospira sp. WS238]|nr:hypothetical protein [Nitrospira sp. WS238]
MTGMTKGETTAVGEEALTHVYVPTSPNPTSGYFLLVPEREVTAVDISIEEAMKLIVSGGLYTPSSTIKSALNPDAKWSQIKQPDAGVPIG